MFSREKGPSYTQIRAQTHQMQQPAIVYCSSTVPLSVKASGNQSKIDLEA